MKQEINNLIHSYANSKMKYKGISKKDSLYLSFSYNQDKNIFDNIWQEAQKEVIREFDRELFKCSDDNEEFSAIARVLTKYRAKDTIKSIERKEK